MAERRNSFLITGAPTVTDEARRDVTRTVQRLARDGDDRRELLAMLGLVAEEDET